MKLFFKAVCLMVVIGLLGCDDDAQYASRNVSKDADNFKVKRRIVFYNAILDKYIFEMQGNCSITADAQDRQLEVICQTGENQYKKHYLGYSNNVTYVVEQLDYHEASKYHYKIVFKPESIMPLQNIEIR